MPVKPATAMVLAAGLGLRMRPITEKIPKPLVQVAGKTLLDHVLDKLAVIGVEKAVVNVHYLPTRSSTTWLTVSTRESLSPTSEMKSSAPAAAWSRRCRSSATSRSST